METILSYWHARSQREQRGIIATGVVLLILIIYLGLVKPLADRKRNAEVNLNNQQELSAWVSEKVSEIESLKGSGDFSEANTDLPLNQAITSSAKEYKLEIIRLQPQKEELQVWLQPLSFNLLLEWLDDLEKQYGIVVNFIEVAKDEQPGVVQIKRLQLGRS